MKRVFVLVSLVLAALLIASCIPGPNEMADSPDDDGDVDGFWQGLWHGIIAPITFIVSLFNSNVEIYEVHNNGGWYNLGFLLGMSIIFGGSGGGAARRRRRMRVSAQ